MPWGRPRFRIIPATRDTPARVASFVDEQTAAAKEAVILFAKRHRPPKGLTGPLRIDVVFVVAAPTRLDADRSRLWPHVKPDLDNYLKLILDALNGIFWRDDGQVCAITSAKVYGHPPRSIVRVSPLTVEDHQALAPRVGEALPPQGGLF